MIQLHQKHRRCQAALLCDPNQPRCLSCAMLCCSYGPEHGLEDENIPCLTTGVSDGSRFKLGSFDVTVLHTPCHTRGHVVYVAVVLLHFASRCCVCDKTLRCCMHYTPPTIFSIGILNNRYLVEAPHCTPLLFSGDTLFAGGCGRLFEGTAAEMYSSMQKIVEAVPDRALVCCGCV